jgi:hypothetical protein
MSDELGLIVLAAIFAVGVVLFAVMLIVVLPGVLLAETTITELLRPRRERAHAPAELEP